VEEPALETLTCDTPTEMLCSKGASSSFTACQQPEGRKILLMYELSVVEEGNHITNMCLLYSGISPLGF
jgi:hypothetical protein